MGRRRRASTNSSVASVNRDSIQYAAETSVLRPVPFEDKDTVNFVLEDATVYGKDGRLANLLSVYFDGPYTIRGLVKAEYGQGQRFLRRNVEQVHIEIQNCGRYAVGIAKVDEEDDEERIPCVWAEGQCGWFEIKPPSLEYTPLYSKISEAIGLYYHMEKVHRDHEAVMTKKRYGKGVKRPTRSEIFQALPPEEMFFKYAVRVGDGSVLDEVIRAVDEHAPFLISHCLTAKEEYQWEPTTLFKWLTSRHPDLLAKVLKNEKTRSNKQAHPETTLLDDPPPQKSITKTSQRRSAQPKGNSESETDNLAAKTRGRRSNSREQRLKASATHTPTAEPMIIDAAVAQPRGSLSQSAQPAAENEEACSPAEMLRDAVDDINTSQDKPLKKMTYSFVRSNLYLRYRIKSYYATGEMLDYYAAELLPLLDEMVWGGTGFYNGVKEAARKTRPVSEAFDPSHIAEYLTRRSKGNGGAQNGTHSPPRKPTVKVPAAQQSWESSQLETPPPRPRGRPSGKMSSLRPSGKKRLFSDVDVDDDNPEGSVRGFKLPKLAHFEDEKHEDEGEDADEVHTDDEDEDGDVTKEAVKIVIRGERVPDFGPKGPNGTWVCDQEEGCGFLERNPGEDEGKERIQQHLRQVHFEDDDEVEEVVKHGEDQLDRINLAMTEGGRENLPVDHLLEMLRSKGASMVRNQQREINGQVVPQPIKRRLIV